MNANTMTAADFTAILAAAGIDLNAHGGTSQAAKLLGVWPNAVTQARNGKVTPKTASEARRLQKMIADGSFTPANPSPAQRDAALAMPIDPEDEMSDDELLADINERFETMNEFVEFAIDGMFKSVLVTGPGGIGKTYPIEMALREYQENNPGAAVVCVSGAISAVGLYEALWNTQNKGDVLLIDDADGGFAQTDFLNVLKAATDSKGRRVVSWNKQNAKMKEAGIEAQFEYHGSVIIISNANLKAKAENGNGHIDAVLSRAMHIDLGINSSRALALRVKFMIEEAEMFAQLFAKFGVTGDAYDTGKREISAFIVENRDAFRSLTLREADKIARMYLAATKKGRDWRRMARLSLGAL